MPYTRSRVKQPKGWVQIMFGTPLSISSSISAGKSQPSPHFASLPMKGSMSSVILLKGREGRKRPLLFKSLFNVFSFFSKKAYASLPVYRRVGLHDKVCSLTLYYIQNRT